MMKRLFAKIASSKVVFAWQQECLCLCLLNMLELSSQTLDQTHWDKGEKNKMVVCLFKMEILLFVAIITTTVGDKLVAQREFHNQFVIKVLNGKVWPYECLRICWYFLTHEGRGLITVEVFHRLSSMLQTALWGNGNSLLCDVFLF